MKPNRIFIVFALLFSFAFSISAQDENTPNEVQIDGFLKRENFDRFQFLISTKENIKTMFGEDCQTGNCNYDNDWGINFSYAGKVLENKRTSNERTLVQKFSTTYYKPEAVGKLIEIHFLPRKRNVIPDDFVFPAEYKCADDSNSRQFICWRDGIAITYDYKKREDGTVYQKVIRNIRVTITAAERETIRGETEVKVIEEKKSNP